MMHTTEKRLSEEELRALEAETRRVPFGGWRSLTNPDNPYPPPGAKVEAVTLSTATLTALLSEIREHRAIHVRAADGTAMSGALKSAWDASADAPDLVARVAWTMAGVVKWVTTGRPVVGKNAT